MLQHCVSRWNVYIYCKKWYTDLPMSSTELSLYQHTVENSIQLKKSGDMINIGSDTKMKHSNCRKHGNNMNHGLQRSATGRVKWCHDIPNVEQYYINTKQLVQLEVGRLYFRECGSSSLNILSAYTESHHSTTDLEYYSSNIGSTLDNSSTPT